MAWLSGRALFQINPELFADGDDAGADEDIIFEDDEETKEAGDSEEEKKEEGGNDTGAATVQVDSNLFAD